MLPSALLGMRAALSFAYCTSCIVGRSSVCHRHRNDFMAVSWLAHATDQRPSVCKHTRQYLPILLAIYNPQYEQVKEVQYAIATDRLDANQPELTTGLPTAT